MKELSKRILNKTLNDMDKKWRNPTNHNSQKLWICWKLLNDELNFNSFSPQRVFDLNKESKRNTIIEEIATEIDMVIKEIID